MLAKFFAVVCFLIQVSAFAEKLPEPKVDYSADGTMEAQSMSMTYKVYATQGKQRQVMGDDGMVTIMRKDKNVIWQLMPEKMYMEMPMQKGAANDPSLMDIQEKKAMGSEIVNGIKTTKYKVIATTKDGKKFGGHFYISAEDITVKMDMLLIDGKEKTRIVTELKKLNIGKQNPSLFELPPGYQKFSMG